MPGVPGAGLSGLFYVLAALVALVLELAATLRGRSSMARWRVVIRQSSLAACIVLSITVVYSAARLLFSDTSQPASQLHASGTVVEPASQPVDTASLELLPIAPVVMTIGALVLLLTVTLLLGRVVRRRRAPEEQPAVPVGPEEVPPALEPAPAVAA